MGLKLISGTVLASWAAMSPGKYVSAEWSQTTGAAKCQAAQQDHRDEIAGYRKL